MRLKNHVYARVAVRFSSVSEFATGSHELKSAVSTI